MMEREGDRGMAPQGSHVLVCGASFAGLSTAFWMRKHGFRVTIVEVAGGLRRGGTPVDIKENVIDCVKRMGLLDAIRAKSLPPRRIEFKTADGATEAMMPAPCFELDAADEQHEIERDDLLDILMGTVEDDVDIIFGRSVLRIEEMQPGVMVTFDDGSRRAFALVFGCDGMRSNTRRLVFGDADHLHFLNTYCLLKVVPRPMMESAVTQIFTLPGRTVMLNGYHSKTDIAVGFHADREIPYDRRDRAHQKRLVVERLQGMGWRVPELLEELDRDDDFYFDKICQVRMPAWSRGHVALVGDAGYCPSPAAGMGGSLALLGAAALADGFERHPDDVDAAFRSYEAQLRPIVEAVQDEAVSVGLKMFAPESEAAIGDRNRMIAAWQGGA